MMSWLPAWIAGPFGRWGGKIIAVLAVMGGIGLGLMGIRRSARRDGRKQEALENRAERAERALKEGEENAERERRMDDARSDGPHSRRDIVERLRDGEG